MRKLSSPASFYVLLATFFVFLSIYYSKAFLNPNNFLFSPNGDGISSYYNSYYHIEHDSTYLNFQGMNYPFGEHITYSVNNPLLTNSIKFPDNYFPKISDYTVGIINFSMLFSLLLTVIFLFLIFKELKVNPLFSAFSSIGITVLSPQIFRMMGHLSLAYAFAIPLLLWILIKNYKNKNRLIWYFILFTNQVFWIFVHPYYTALNAALLISFAFIDYFFSKDVFREKLSYTLSLIFIGIFPIILYKIFLLRTDYHLFRTDNPYGFLIFTSGIKTVFIPHHPPLKPLLDRIIVINQVWEGWAYLGLGTILTFFFSLLFILKQKFKNQLSFKNNPLFDHKLLNILLISAHIIFVFSMGLPFKIVPGYLPDFLGFLKEFRALGRFAWIYYFVVSIYCIYVLNKLIIYFNSRNKQILSYLIIYSYSGLLIIEGLPYHHELSKSITATPNYFKSGTNPEIDKALEYTTLSEYQAIMPLPFYHNGSENFTRPHTNKILMLSELVSFKTGIPLLSSYLARTSIKESKLLIQLISPVCYLKPIKQQFKEKKPFLIIYSKELLTENESYILKRSVKLAEYHEFSLYQLDFDSLFRYYKKPELLDTSLILHDGFENKITSPTYKGKGAYRGKMADWNILYKFDADSVILGQNYEISFWMYNCGPNYGQDKLNSMVFIDYENTAGEKEWLSMVNPSNAETIDGCWSKVTLEVKIDTSKSKTSKFQLILKGDGRLKHDFFLDELVMKKD